MIDVLSADKLINQCMRAIGYTLGAPAGTAFGERLCDAIDEAVLRVWRAARWPQLCLFEKRIYRPQFDPSLLFDKGRECFWNGEYWRSLVDAPVDEPSEASAQWQKLKSGEFVKFIALDQSWEPNEIDLPGVDLNAFAFATDPRYYSNAAPISPCRWMGDYPGGGTTRILLPENAPNVVTICFMPKVPRFTLDQWNAVSAEVYSYGDAVYYKGDCWICVADSTTEEPGVGCDWKRQTLPRFMAGAVKTYVKASFQEDDQGRAATWKRFNEELQLLKETYFGGTGAVDEAAFSAFDD